MRTAIASGWERPYAWRHPLDDVFDNFFQLTRSAASGPRFLSNESDHGLELEADVPGLRPEDLQVSAEGSVLTVKGERREPTPEGFTPIRRERSAYAFERSFRMPEHLNLEEAVAQLEHGILRIQIPRRPEAQPRTITVTSA